MTPEPVADKPPLLLRKGFWFGLACAVPLLLCALWLAEDWRGRRQLAETKTRLAAAGLDLSPAALWPGRVPEEENFCATPVIMDLWRTGGSRRTTSPTRTLYFQLDEIIRIDELSSLGAPGETNWKDRIMSRLQKMASNQPPWTPRPGTLLAAVPEDSPQPEQEFAAALERQLAGATDELDPRLDLPAAQLSPGIHSFTPDRLVLLRDVFIWRAHLALAIGEPERGVRSWRILWRLAEALQELGLGPEYTATMTRLRAGDWLWTALHNRRLNDAQLMTVGAEAGKVDAMACAKGLFLKGLAQTESHVESMKSDLSQRAQLFDDSYQVWGGSPGYVMPAGWLDANLAHCYQLIWASLNDLQRTGVPWSLTRTAVTVPMSKADRLVGHERLALGWGWRNPIGVRMSLARNHVISALSVAACALERHSLAHQNYPATLSALVPGFLAAVPMDLDGLPLRYAPDPRNGRYKLWSVGSNGTDDGGRVDKPPRERRPRIVQLQTGDWVWEYPLVK